MGKFLRSVGNGAYRHKWLVIASWVIILIVLVCSRSIFISSQAVRLAFRALPPKKLLIGSACYFQMLEKALAGVVFEAKNGETVLGHKTDIEAAITEIGKVEGVRQVTDPFTVTGSISSDNTVAYATVSLSQEAAAVSEKTITDISKISDDVGSKGLAMYRGGDIISRVPSDILGQAKSQASSSH